MLPLFRFQNGVSRFYILYVSLFHITSKRGIEGRIIDTLNTGVSRPGFEL